MKNKKKILVTGGAGFIGSHTVVELFKNGFEPIIVDNFSNSDSKVINRINKIIGDTIKVYDVNCNSFSQLNSVFENEKNIEGVIHFAAYKSVGESVDSPLKYYYNNLNSLINLLDIVSQKGINNLVFSSSATVYGDQSTVPFHEDLPLQPALSPYGNTKKICEDILCDSGKAFQKFNLISLRYFNPIGAHPSALIGELPNGVPNNLVPYITQTGAGIRKELIVFGNDYNTPDGTCIRDYVHVMDLASAHVKALDHLFTKSGNYYEVFNIGTGKGSSVMELINIFEKVSGVKLNYTIGKKRSGDLPFMYADISKAASILNWKAQLSIEEAMAHAWEWQKNVIEKEHV